jgi:hypothetical protein
MLKKRMKELLQEQDPEMRRNFELLKDQEASEVLGGCAALEQCDMYSSGSCPNLKICGTYMET